jgi:uncharacterized membrane protein
MTKTIFQTIEGKILITGCVFFLLMLMVTGYIAMSDIETAKTLVLAFFAHTFGGRAAGIGLCIMNGFGPVATIGYNFFLEVLIVCFTYSIFVLTTTNYIRVVWVQKFIDRLAEKAIEQKEKIQAYGWIGLFLFVMLPLPVTGPVVGSVIGYMLRINLVRNLSATCSGTLAAIVVWFYCFDFLEQRFHAIQYIFMAIVLLVVITKYKPIIRFFTGKKK